MPSYLQNFGLGFLEEENQKDALMGVLHYALEKAKPIVGYYGFSYFNYHYGDMQIILRTQKQEDETLHVTGFDTHCKGRSVWDVQIVDDLSGNGDPLSRKLLLRGKDGKGLFIADIVNADVLPSFSKDEVLRLQMIAYTDKIMSYENEESFSRTAKPGVNGIKMTIGKDVVFPVGLFSKANEGDEREVVHVHGTIKSAFYGTVRMEEEGEKYRPFIYCKVQTHYGDLEIVMNAENINDDQIQYIKEGCVADCYAWLCGDAAIFELDKGIVRNAENNLMLVRYTIEKGDPERLRSVLSDHFVYYSENSGMRFENPDEYFDFVNCVHKEGAGCRAFYATIEEYTKDTPPGYSIGTRCLILKYEDEDFYNSIVFVDTDEEGKIARIYLSKDTGYRFQTDRELPEPAEEYAFTPDPDVRKRLMGRASFLCLFTPDTDLEKVEAIRIERKKEISEALESLSETEHPDAETVGKAFLLGVEKSRLENYDTDNIMDIGAHLYTDLSSGRKEKEKDSICHEYLPFIMAMGILYAGKANEHE